MDFSSIKDQHPLFECEEDDFNTFLQQTKKIQELSDQKANLDKQSADYHSKSRPLREKINEQKQQRARFFQEKTKKTKKTEKKKKTETKYKKFCNLFKSIAMKRGKILAAVKGLEKEQIDSQLLNYWALIVEKHHCHYLMLIPKQHRQIAYKMLDEEFESPDAAIKIHYFKSLTMRALHKLCFGVDGNSFAKDVCSELRQKYANQYSQIKGAFSLGEFKSEEKIVRFYQAVLNTNYVRNSLDIQDFEGLQALIENKQIQTKDQFEIELEKICYITRQLAGDDLESDLLNECGASLLKISSYDLRKQASRQSADKRHTQLWHRFWSGENRDAHYPIRLNPELKIHWRDAKQSRVKKYGKDSELYDPSKNNRFLHPQLTLVTTITDNALGQRYDLAFTKLDDLEKKIVEFNTEFNQTHVKNQQQMYYYGIDRGQKELATLVIVSGFSKEKNEHQQAIPEFAEFKVWQLKKEYLNYGEPYQSEGTTKIRKAINNLSYFIDRDDLFEQVQTSAIDLTTAKLIKGKIVANGDVLSYLKLKELSAKRRLYEYWSQAKIDTQKELSLYFLPDKQIFCLHNLDDNPQVNVYYYRPEFESICNKAEIQKMLQDYLQQLNTTNQHRDILTIEKINHLRDAMAANMVGVIAHLYQQFPGIIALENLEQSSIDSHFNASNENISRRLEWRLYNRFQHQGRVPPRIKESIVLRQTQDIKQFGAVLFVPVEDTSQECPKCGKRATVMYNGEKPFDKKDDELTTRFKDNKYATNPKFDCPHCDFDTSNGKDLPDINDPDKVASFNVAKKAYEYILKPPEPKPADTQANTKKPHNKKQPKRNNAKPAKPRPMMLNQPFADLDKLLKK